MRLGPVLRERDGELAVIRASIETASSGRGAFVLVEAPAGLGKSRLLDEAVARARAYDVEVLRARASALEQDQAWGTAAALLWSAVRRLPPPRREAFEASPAAAILGLGEVARPRALEPDAAVLPIAHALLSLVDVTAGRGPLLLTIDDAHWADVVSLRFVHYLLQRLDELAIAILVTRRPREPTAARPLLDAIALDPAVRRLSLAPLSPAGVAGVVREELADVPPELCDRVHALTAGNPLYLRQLLVDLRGDDGALDTARLDDAAPEAVARSVLLRIDRVGADARALAGAVAVLADGTPLRRATLLAGISEQTGRRAADALAAAEILRPGEPLGFVHPVVAAAVHADLAPATRADAHLRAARLEAEDGAPPERLATHLVHAPRRGDPWVAGKLRAAAERALEGGDAGAAVALLRRAAEEPPPAQERAATLVALGRAQSLAADPAVVETFDGAIALLAGAERAAVRAELGRALFRLGRGREAAAAFQAGRAELGGAPAEVRAQLEAELRAGYLGVAHFDPELRPEAEADVAALLRSVEQGATPAERALLAQLAFGQVTAGAPRETVRRLCERAWGDGRLLADEGSDGITWTLVAGTLYWIDDLERALELLGEVMADARRRGSPLAFATASWCTGPPLLQQGEVMAALDHVEVTLDARRYGWAQHLGSLHRLHARCLIERGDRAGARATLAVMDEPGVAASGEFPMLLEVRGRLRLVDGDAAGALEDFEAAGRLFEDTMHAFLPSMLPWRSSAALALRRLGRRDRALELLDHELELASAAGVERAVSRALRIRGLVEGGPAGTESLRRAVSVLDGVGPRLERTAGLVELGAALRRSGLRREAREPLHAAFAAAVEGGATALAERARAELAAAGSRPRRPVLTGADALTSSERRVARMAAEGMTNREIAETLFVTIKTVEWHLRHTFRKLEVDGRRQLAAALEGAGL